MEKTYNVLLVEDNQELNNVNSRALRSQNYQVYSALTLAAAEKILQFENIHVVLLDVMLPDGDGFTFCQKIRKRSQVPIIFLTAKASHEAKMQGLLGGGDDYITKPFHPEELLARVAICVRRSLPSIGETPLILEMGPLKLDLLNATAAIYEREIHLTSKEFLILSAILQASEESVTKELLLEKLYPEMEGYDYTALWKHISRLKRKLAEVSQGKVVLVTERGLGYHLEYPF